MVSRTRLFSGQPVEEPLGQTQRAERDYVVVDRPARELRPGPLHSLANALIMETAPEPTVSSQNVSIDQVEDWGKEILEQPIVRPRTLPSCLFIRNVPNTLHSRTASPSPP